QGYRRVWAGLRGRTLAFYGGPRDSEPLEVLDLGELVAVRAEGGGLVLRMKGQEVTLKVRGTPLRGAPRGFGGTRGGWGHGAGKGVPRVPSCFFEVTRPEAERLLERSEGEGNMVLRPGGHGRGVSVTTRQELNGTVLLKHYRVNRVDEGYVIDVDAPHRCSSLAEVVQYFVERSKGNLRPLHREYSPRL
ncbi:STAP2 protein, partial [Corythaixoides concolor]|nr:STAP2 protein [Corythaixoides concolor]